MFKKDSQLSLEKRFSISFIIWIFSVAALFVFTEFFHSEFVGLINALMFVNNLSVGDYIGNGIGWFIAILIFILWSSVWLLLIAAKKELIILIRQ